jgi:hypothetical protein
MNAFPAPVSGLDNGIKLKAWNNDQLIKALIKRSEEGLADIQRRGAYPAVKPKS